MGTSAFDAAWDKPQTAAFDAAWDGPAQKVHDYHAEYKSGALQKRMAGANARDAASAADPDAEPVSMPQAAGHALVATGANIAQGIPGMTAVEAGARSLVRGQPYREAYSDINQQTAKIPGALRTGERIAGSLPLAGKLPGSAATAGALIGGADQVLSGDPDKGIGNRAATGALGAGVGALAGKGAEWMATGIRAAAPRILGGAENTAQALIRQQAERAGSAKAMFNEALKIGKGREATPAVQQFLAEDDIAPRVADLQKTDLYKNIAHDSPLMLDAVYKSLSDEAKGLQKGLNAYDPRNANLGRVALGHVKSLQQRLLGAMESGGTKTVETAAAQPAESLPAIQTAQSPAPDTRTAVSNFWDRQGAAAHRAGDGMTSAQRMAREMLERRSATVEAGPVSGGSSPRLFPAQPAQTADVALPPMMPTYRDAVADYASRTSGIKALLRGHDSMQGAISSTVPSSRNLLTRTPEGLAEWAKNLTPNDAESAASGVLGATRMNMAQGLRSALIGNGRRAAWQAPSLLRTLGDPTQQTLDQAIKALLLGGNASR
jgi:hypothetical protein